MAAIKSAAPVFAADPVAAKRERAVKLGADFALDPTAADFAETLKLMTPNPESAIFKGAQSRGVKGAGNCAHIFGRRRFGLRNGA